MRWVRLKGQVADRVAKQATLWRVMRVCFRAEDGELPLLPNLRYLSGALAD